MSWAARFELRQYLGGSLWVVPLVGGVLGAFLAQATLWLDGVVRLPPDWNYSASTASGVLTAIAGAMVALLGFVVTIGVLVVQQATGTLSPRYMRLWYRDRLQKGVLATFAGTFTFAFGLLRRIEDDFVPDIGVTLAASPWRPVWDCCSSTLTASPTVYARSRWPRSSDSPVWTFSRTGPRRSAPAPCSSTPTAGRWRSSATGRASVAG